MIELYEGRARLRQVLSRDLREVPALGATRPTTLYRGRWNLFGPACRCLRVLNWNIPRTADHDLERLRRSPAGLSHMSNPGQP
jgi:hypothetical protein